MSCGSLASRLRISSGDAVAEVFGVGDVAHVDEGQHADADPLVLFRCGDWAAAWTEHGLQCLAQPPERGVLAILAPAVQIGRMHGAEIDRQLGVVEPHRHQHAAIGGIARFATHPARFHRVRGPDHDQGPGALELARDQGVEFLARCDLRIPPDRPAFSFKHGHERCDPSAVLAGIGNEDIGQGFSPRGKCTIALPRARGATNSHPATPSPNPRLGERLLTALQSRPRVGFRSTGRCGAASTRQKGQSPSILTT